MKKTNLFLSIFSIFLVALIFSYSLVFAWPLDKPESSFVLSQNLFKDSLDLSSNKIVVKSKETADKFTFSWDCELYWKILKTDWYTHIFDIKLLDKSCPKEKIDVYLKTPSKTLKYTFSIISEYKLYEKYLDYASEDLKILLENMETAISDLSVLNNLTSEEKIQFQRKLEELNYLRKFFTKILEGRELKYSVPVIWATKMTRETKVPNSWRPYRKWYTDWIHHWWDFDYKMWTEVVAIDDWIIVRIVNDFKNSDFWKIKRTWDLTETDKLINLDILRWNQVWLKTMKWDVIFYSHLDKVSENLKVWDVVSRNQVLWTIWVTWVPEEGYSDYHLHMDVKINPLDTSKAWTYTFIDMMAWPWSYKGQSAKYALEKQTELFDFK